MIPDVPTFWSSWQDQNISAFDQNIKFRNMTTVVAKKNYSHAMGRWKYNQQKPGRYICFPEEKASGDAKFKALQHTRPVQGVRF